MPYVTVERKKIYYEEYGVENKQTIVYFHGGPGESCLTYMHQAKLLSENFHIIIFDQYGVFRSDEIPQNTPFGITDHVKLIEKMRVELNINSWTPLGHSYGGMLALLYSFTYPNSVDKIIYDCPMWSVLSTSKAIASALLPYYKEHNQTKEIQICEEILYYNILPRDAFDKAMDLELDDEMCRYCHVIDKSVYEKYIINYIPQPNLPEKDWIKYIHFTKMLFEKEDFYINYLPLLSEINKPSLLMVGEYDMTCGEEEQKYFCEHTANGTFVVLKNSAHLSWIQMPEKYTSTIIEFMK